MCRDVYELLSAKPHELPCERLTDEQRRFYLRGYDYALIIALRVLQAATENHHLAQRTRRQQRLAEALARRERRDRLRLLLTRACAWWDVEHRHFCGAAAEWLMVDGANRPIELRCSAHRTAESHQLPGDGSEANPGAKVWTLEWDTGEIRTKKHRPDRP